MRKRSAIVFPLVAALAGCGAEVPPAASTPAPISAAKAAEQAHGGPLKPADAEPPRASRSASGSMTAKIDGKAVTFPFLPYGTNALIDVPERGIARVWLSGALEASGFPTLRISLEHVRLETLALPIDLSAAASAKPPAEIEIRYSTDDRRSWHSRSDAPEGERPHVRIESFDGTTVRGTFAATLQPKSKAFGGPMRIEDGRFALSLRRSDGVSQP